MAIVWPPPPLFHACLSCHPPLRCCYKEYLDFVGGRSKVEVSKNVQFLMYILVSFISFRIHRWIDVYETDWTLPPTPLIGLFTNRHNCRRVCLASRNFKWAMNTSRSLYISLSLGAMLLSESFIFSRSFLIW